MKGKIVDTNSEELFLLLKEEFKDSPKGDMLRILVLFWAVIQKFGEFCQKIGVLEELKNMLLLPERKGLDLFSTLVSRLLEKGGVE